ncbi:MAG: DUF3575 domain-containing protein [Rikenellaceae bacterium]
MVKRVAIILSLSFLYLSGYGQTIETSSSVVSKNREGSSVVGDQIVEKTNYNDTFTIYYRINSSEVDPFYLSNADAMELVRHHLRDTLALAHLDSLSLSAISSPDGPFVLNQRLSEQRANRLREYIIGVNSTIESKIKVGYSGEDWVGLRRMVLESDEIPNKDEVLSIIDSELALDAKESRLKRLDGGSSWRYITNNILKYLRYGASAIFHYDLTYRMAQYEPIAQDRTIPQTEIVCSNPIKPLPVEYYLPVEIIEEPEAVEYTTKPLFAHKTNLLFDAASLLNVELEIPFGKRVSLAGEWIFPWWTWDDGTADSYRHRIQLLNANLTAKYWLGNREDRPVMTGWYVGLYAGGGLYDFEYDRKGIQGEFFIAAGVSAGYAHTINKSGSLRMEYSLGAGYLQTEYRDYEAFYGVDDAWHPIRLSTKSYTWLGPTQAKVSLVWLMSRKSKVRKEGSR